MDDSVSRQNEEYQTDRPLGATHRVIYSLYVDMEPEPGDKPGGEGLVIPLGRDGRRLTPRTTAALVLRRSARLTCAPATRCSVWGSGPR
jgi:hypothetical protein